MLRQRVITALIMAGIFLSAIVFLPLPALAAVFGLLVTAGGWEWSRLAGWQSPVTRGLYMLLLAACMAVLYWYCQLGNAPVREQVQPFLGLACLWWSFALLWVKSYPMSAVLWRTVFMRSLMGLLILVPAWLAAVFLLSFPRGGLLVVQTRGEGEPRQDLGGFLGWHGGLCPVGPGAVVPAARPGVPRGPGVGGGRDRDYRAGLGGR
jgi:phosphatidate cytidylyltransferase